jgi:protein TonB
MTNTYNVSSFVWRGGNNYNFLMIAIFLHIAVFFSFIFEREERFEPISFGVQFSISSSAKASQSSISKQEEEVVTTKNESKNNISKEKTQINQGTNTQSNDQSNKSSDDSAMVEYTIGSSENPAPHYPAIAKRNQWEGVSKICAKVDANGLVKLVTVCGSSGYDILDNSAIQAVSGWRFKVKQKTKELYNVSVKINFTLK